MSQPWVGSGVEPPLSRGVSSRVRRQGFGSPAASPLPVQYPEDGQKRRYRQGITHGPPDGEYFSWANRHVWFHWRISANELTSFAKRFIKLAPNMHFVVFSMCLYKSKLTHGTSADAFLPLSRKQARPTGSPLAAAATPAPPSIISGGTAPVP